MNGTSEGMNITYLTLLMLLHYVVKVETPEMHVNATSAFNVNNNTDVTRIKFHDSFIKYSDESYKWTFISEHVF